MFQSDYGQARATYFASILNQAAPTTATSGTVLTTDAFMQYTTQRVALLGQQLTSAFLQYSRGTAHAKGQDSTLKLLVMMYITGNGKNTASLAASLKASMPQVGASAPDRVALLAEPGSRHRDGQDGDVQWPGHHAEPVLRQQHGRPDPPFLNAPAPARRRGGASSAPIIPPRSRFRPCRRGASH